MSAVVLLLLLGMMCMCAFAGLLLLLNLKKKKKTPGTSPGTSPGTPPTIPGGNSNVTDRGGGMGDKIRTEADLWAQVQANVNALMAHVRKKYANTRFGRALINTYREVGQHTQNNSGMAIGGRIEIRIRGNVRRLPDVNNTITHELGHVTDFGLGGGGHGRQWRECFLWLTNIAVNDLGWSIGFGELDCSTYNLCESTSKSLCPKCVWGWRGMKADTWRQEAPRMPSGLLA